VVGRRTTVALKRPGPTVHLENRDHFGGASRRGSWRDSGGEPSLPRHVAARARRSSALTFHAVFMVACPGCSARYPVDSGKVPAGGVRARCGKCTSIFLVESGAVRVRATTAPAGASRKPRKAEAPRPFAVTDPADRAARLARVLVSDMIRYHRDRYERALERGTLKEDFAEEVRRSWSEYVRRVGEDLAHDSRYFQDELNTTLACGEQLF